MPQSVKDAFEGKGVNLEILVRTEYILEAYCGLSFSSDLVPGGKHR
jgi:hypothetical protein